MILIYAVRGAVCFHFSIDAPEILLHVLLILPVYCGCICILLSNLKNESGNYLTVHFMKPFIDIFSFSKMKKCPVFLYSTTCLWVLYIDHLSLATSLKYPKSLLLLKDPHRKSTCLIWILTTWVWSKIDL